MTRHPTYNFWVGYNPPTYAGLWALSFRKKVNYLSEIVLVRSGRLYIAELPANTVASHCEGEFIGLRSNECWAIPAFYVKREYGWYGLTRGCTDIIVKRPDITGDDQFAFTYEDGKLHLRHGTTSHRLCWRRTTKTEIDMLSGFT